MMTSNYAIVKNHDIQEFSNIVTKMVQDGYKPVGGLCIHHHKHEGTAMFYQSMVKRESFSLRAFISRILD